MGAIALAQLGLQLLPTVETGAVQLWNFITAVRTSAQQTGEWTDTAEAAYQQALLKTKDDPAYQPDTPAA